LNRQHNRQEVQRYYRAAHLCMVTSLHDGMNLVAKEYVAAREDERGVLILSQFTGAARDLQDAILVNPYDIRSTGEAIAQALEMDINDIRLPDASHAKIGEGPQHLLVGRHADRRALRPSSEPIMNRRNSCTSLDKRKMT
jgi:glycosyltransferase involved in cell wall biosynthesis